jgi:hypothetical protein
MSKLVRSTVWSFFLVAMTAALGAQTANVSGRWVGAFDTVRADGGVVPSGAFLLLKQDGKTVSGTAGDSEAHQSPISAGEVDGQHVRFDVVVNPQMTAKFDLVADGDHLHGAATGVPVDAGAKIAVDVRRWPEGAAAPTVTHAQDALFATVSALDTKLFDAYNHCDIATLNTMVEDGLEFYHDKTGLTVGKQPFLEAIKSNICGKTQRTLVAGSLEVYPLADYGAVEIGVHRFTHPGQPEIGVGEAKFITLWHYKDGAWKISRAISFDHGSVQK